MQAAGLDPTTYQKTVSRLLAGKQATVAADLWAALCEALGVTAQGTRLQPGAPQQQQEGRMVQKQDGTWGAFKLREVQGLRVGARLKVREADGEVLTVRVVEVEGGVKTIIPAE